ncbi:hypothetical protein [Microbacterium maritypicum]
MTDYTNEYENDQFAPYFRPQQVKMLADGAISPTEAWNRGVRSLRSAKEQLKAHWPELAWAAKDDSDSGLLFPHTVLHGDQVAPTPLPQYRPDADSPTFLAQEKPAKYLFPKDSGTVLSIGLNARKRLEDGTVRRIALVEGTKQAIAADIWMPSDIAVIGMQGVYGWMVDRNLNAAIVRLCGVEQRNIPITVIPDADVSTNPKVLDAVKRLWTELDAIGADASLGSIPVSAGAKAGLDDFLGSLLDAERTEALSLMLAQAAPRPIAKVTAADEDAETSAFPDQRPTIRLEDKALDEVAGDAVKAAASASRGGQPFVFRKVRRDGVATALVTVTQDGRIQHWSKSNAYELFFLLLQPVKRERYDAKKDRMVAENEKSFPHDMASILYDVLLGTPRIPAVRTLATEPVLLTDGRTIAKPGYHRAEQVLISIPLTQRAAWTAYSVPENPTATDAQTALDYLSVEMLTDVPFATAADRAVALAYFVTVGSRTLYATAPGFAFDAPEKGTGKSLVASCGRIICQGDASYQAVSHEKSKDTETWKQLGTLAVTGGRFAHTDEVGRGDSITSLALSELITAPIVKTRALGLNAEIIIEGVTTTFCGNNLRLGADFGRRVLPSRLHFVGTGKAARRTGFRHANLTAWATAHRAELLSAIHTLMKHGIVSGAQAEGQLGSFEDWSRFVLGALSTVTVEGENAAELVLSAQEITSDLEDDLSAEWGDFMAYWHGLLPGEEWVTTPDISEKILKAQERPHIPDTLLMVSSQAPKGIARAWTHRLKAVVDTPMVLGPDRFALSINQEGRQTAFRVKKV